MTKRPSYGIIETVGGLCYVGKYTEMLELLRDYLRLANCFR